MEYSVTERYLVAGIVLKVPDKYVEMTRVPNPSDLIIITLAVIFVLHGVFCHRKVYFYNAPPEADKYVKMTLGVGK
ncbi:hypothetical protein ACROYT_G044762 [Oculina patagonica]